MCLKPLFFEKNEIKWNQTDTRWGICLNSNHPLLNGIKQTMYFLGSIKWRFWDAHDLKFAGIFIIIFVISASKYVGKVSFKLIKSKYFSKVHLKIIHHSLKFDHFWRIKLEKTAFSLNLNQSNFHRLNHWFAFSLIHQKKNIFHCQISQFSLK